MSDAPFDYKKVCVHGHEMSGGNIGVQQRGGFCCKTCSRARANEAKRRRRAGLPPLPRRSPRTHCREGHEFTPENTIFTVKVKGHKPQRVCRACKRERQRREYWAQEDRREVRRARNREWHRKNPERSKEIKARIPPAGAISAKTLRAIAAKVAAGADIETFAAQHNTTAKYLADLLLRLKRARGSRAL